MSRFFSLRAGFAAGYLALAALICVGVAAGAPTPARGQEKVDLSGFDDWVASFRVRAIAAGIPAAVFDDAFKNVKGNAKVIETDQNQAEFSLAIWEYLKSAVSERRVSDGRAVAQANSTSLAAIEERYGVPKEIVVAIWGVESAYGENRGGFDVIRSMATLAFEGRRKKRFEAELLAALRILQSGDIEPRKMVGSWAGAMGHTQFMPSSYLELAVDFDGDGKRDIWSDNPIDALASTAQYLSARGWKTGEPWGVEVKIPPEFDYRLLDGGPRNTAFWAERGIRLPDGAPLPTGLEGGELFLPAGANGPAFLVFNNFRVLLTYNSASVYALAVALLAERIGGAPAHAFAWPVEDRPLKRDERRELQQTLTDLGFDTGGVDGILGANTRAAIRRFQASQGLIADGYASTKLLDYVRRALAAREGPLLDAQGGPATVGDVREIQAFLAALGYEIGKIDGQAGRRTNQALERFVKDSGLQLKPEPSQEILEALRVAVRDE